MEVWVKFHALCFQCVSRLRFLKYSAFARISSMPLATNHHAGRFAKRVPDRPTSKILFDDVAFMLAYVNALSAQCAFYNFETRLRPCPAIFIFRALWIQPQPIDLQRIHWL